MTLTEKGKVNSNIFKWKNTEIKLQTKFFLIGRVELVYYS